MRVKHLTEEALLELAGQRLSTNDRQLAEKHLVECAACRREFADFQFVHSVIGHMAEIGYQEALGEPARDLIKNRKEFAFPWTPALAVVAGCLCVLAILLFYPRMIPAVNASELLSDAMQHETDGSKAAGFRIQVSGQICASGRRSEQLVLLETSVRCHSALQHINKTRWASGNPLSARTYAAWRSALKHRTDHVIKNNASWEIRTIAEEDDTVREASLELRASDFHPTKLTLDFIDDEEVSISEDTEPLPAVLPVADIVTKVVPPKPQYVDNPGDLLEVQAWMALHQLNADSGWEAIVLRNGPDVRVKAVVPDDNRKQAVEKEFAAYPGISLEIHFAANPGDISDLFPARIHITGEAPALATDWLRQQYENSEARAEFSNQALRFSQKILGRAFIVDKLEKRRAALAHCSCEKDMAALVEAEKRSLGELEAGLSANIEPMFSARPGSSSHVLTLAEAMRLDASLHELLWRGSDSADTTFDASLQQVNSLLIRN
ncbi:hypothetical protein [Paracidobacterium acidisoli]|uniref:Zinc-finger domain-containing protein n=1 Tax=Paracidobacterium acidisoli TaxID=2303751 RepID=A0A372IJN1_9BACT|nr:hypothetical protein [Paracidobacterium acidisoli]MBT9332990.1 hypothetical protein [Paracidobacterium acidisoli]